MKFLLRLYLYLSYLNLFSRFIILYYFFLLIINIYNLSFDINNFYETFDFKFNIDQELNKSKFSGPYTSMFNINDTDPKTKTCNFSYPEVRKIVGIVTSNDYNKPKLLSEILSISYFW